MKRVTRKHKLSAAQSARYSRIRKEIENELPSLEERHQQRMAVREQLDRLLEELKAVRKRQKISLSSMAARTGMDKAAISRLEAGHRVNPTVDTLSRYASAVGKQVTFSVSP